MQRLYSFVQRESGVLVLKCKKLCLQEMGKLYRCWILVSSVYRIKKLEKIMPFLRAQLEKITRGKKLLILLCCDTFIFIFAGLFSNFIVFGNIRNINFYVFVPYLCAQIIVLFFSKYYRLRISDGSLDLVFKSVTSLLLN